MLSTFLSVRNELFNEIASLSDQQLNLKYSEEKWSVAQVIRHIIFADETIFAALKKAVQEDSERVPEKNLNFVLDRNKKVKSPFPEPTIEFISKEDLMKMASQERMPFLDFINEMIGQGDIEGKSMIHPVFGAISIKQMMEFVYLHEKRHIAQIKAMKENILNDN